jgi:hypothetical protein
VVNYFPSFTAFNTTLIYNNIAFIDAFSQRFVSFAANLDQIVTKHHHPCVAQVVAETETVFNETDLGALRIAPVNTSSALLERCEQVVCRIVPINNSQISAHEES